MDCGHYRLKATCIYLATIVTAGLLTAGCSPSRQPPKSSPATPTASAQKVTTPPPANQQKNPPVPPKPLAQRIEPKVPLTAEQIKTREQSIAQTKGYVQRLAQRRTLAQDLIKQGQAAEAIQQIDKVVSDVEKTEGADKAQRVALAEANTLRINGHHAEAAQAYDLLINKYPQGRFTAESIMQMGVSQMDAKQYAQAEKSWLRLVQEHNDAPEAPLGWRKLALAQLVQGQFEDCLATLETMATKYPDTEYADYARMRRGYVYMAKGDLAKAREQYNNFMANCPNSKYCLLAREQIAQLEAPSSSSLSKNNNASGR
jgi:TolA-binding protein